MEMPKARQATAVLGMGRKVAAFSFDSEDITFRWDPELAPHGGLRTTTAGGAKIELRPSVVTRPTFLGKQHRHSWHVAVNGVDLYRDIWSDEQSAGAGTAPGRESRHRGDRGAGRSVRARGSREHDADRRRGFDAQLTGRSERTPREDQPVRR